MNTYNQPRVSASPDGGHVWRSPLVEAARRNQPSGKTTISVAQNVRTLCFALKATASQEVAMAQMLARNARRSRKAA